jgi:hypothetical protein
MNGYIGIYKGKQHEIYANTLYEAQVELAKRLKVKKAYEISVYLCEKDGKDIIQSTAF